MRGDGRRNSAVSDGARRKQSVCFILQLGDSSLTLIDLFVFVVLVTVSLPELLLAVLLACVGALWQARGGNGHELPVLPLPRALQAGH